MKEMVYGNINIHTRNWYWTFLMSSIKLWRVIRMTTKLVNFDEYCTKCKYKKVSQTEEPCNECLTNPVNEDSHKPVMWEAKDDGKR